MQLQTYMLVFDSLSVWMPCTCCLAAERSTHAHAYAQNRAPYEAVPWSWVAWQQVQHLSWSGVELVLFEVWWSALAGWLYLPDGSMLGRASCCRAVPVWDWGQGAADVEQRGEQTGEATWCYVAQTLVKAGLYALACFNHVNMHTSIHTQSPANFLMQMQGCICTCM